MTIPAGDGPPVIAPRVSPHSARYWAELQQARFTVARCVTCRRWTHPPLETCRWCGDPLDFEEVSGRGTVYSHTTMISFGGAQLATPHVVAVVELEEQPGLRVAARLVLQPGETPRIGAQVRHEICTLPGGEYRTVTFRPVLPSRATHRCGTSG